MASLIPGYEYDIFISYRQKDNKHDGWVTEFVDNLKGELESTFKEEISVYFDINPHDGLLETHDVDASLKEKLKCLVFIPIISRTYCDPKSFAWEHEFKAFVELASHDQFGLKIKLPNGNVASRVLAVRIHDLDATDIKQCESVLGGVLRGVEFIYKETGIDKPLSPGDNEKKNLNNTTYRIQIIKVARGIKEIISGLRTPGETGKEIILHKEPIEDFKKESRSQEKPAGLHKRKLIIGGVASGILLVITIILSYPKIFKRDTLERLRSSGERISVAVMPFQNMTNDTTWNVWQDGIQDILITSLSNSEELSLIQVESINNLIKNEGLTNYASITTSIARKISQQLTSDVLITGSIKKAGNVLRLSSQLIDPKTEEILKAFEINGSTNEELFFQSTDSLKNMINDYLVISKMKRDDIFFYRNMSANQNPEAFRYYTYGNRAYYDNDNIASGKYYLKALEIDSSFFPAAIQLLKVYYNRHLWNAGKSLSKKIFDKRDKMNILESLRAGRMYAMFHETPYDALGYLQQLIKIDNQDPGVYYELAFNYMSVGQYDKVIEEITGALKIYEKWKIKPAFVWFYLRLAESYHLLGQYAMEREILEIALREFGDYSFTLSYLSAISLREGDKTLADKYINRYLYLIKNSANPPSDASIKIQLGSIYLNADMIDKAEEYYRSALTLEPKSTLFINTLAYFLINKEKNISEGLELVDTIVESNPDNYDYLHTMGWGLYKQGKYQEALEILQNSWDLRREKAIYNHEAFLHLEAAKKAVAGLKNN